MSEANTIKKTTNGDRVAWLLDVLDRYSDAVRLSGQFPSVSRLPEMAQYAAVLEIAEVMDMKLDENARVNITPKEFRDIAATHVASRPGMLG